jgi:hypothetical protein
MRSERKKLRAQLQLRTTRHIEIEFESHFSLHHEHTSNAAELDEIVRVANRQDRRAPRGRQNGGDLRRGDAGDVEQVALTHRTVHLHVQHAHLPSSELAAFDRPDERIADRTVTQNAGREHGGGREGLCRPFGEFCEVVNEGRFERGLGHVLRSRGRRAQQQRHSE